MPAISDDDQGPRVSAAMPVLNAEGTIEKALSDLVAQTYENLEIVVTDNASDDRTAEIVEQFARIDRRVRLVRFTDRVDIQHNFRRALEASRGTLRSSSRRATIDGIRPSWRETAAVLDARPEVAACCAHTVFSQQGRFSYISNGTRSLTGSHRERLRCYFALPEENARAFGLYRREALEGAFHR